MTSVFYSFSYERDVNRVMLVRNINALEKQPLLTGQKWEEVKKRGRTAVETWIADNMKYKSAVIVLIGQDTASRPWVLYEIEKAWADKRPLLGVRIHGLSSFGSADRAGANPFERASVPTSSIPIYDPTRLDYNGRIDTQATYKQLTNKLALWAGLGASR